MTPRFDPSFDVWCMVVDMRLRGHTGRPLADAPITDAALHCWWAHGVPARIVAQGLSTRLPAVRVTFQECFCSMRVYEIQEQMIGKVAV